LRNQGTQSPRVVIVEDDPLLREEISQHLRDNGFVVDAVNSGAALNDLITADPANLFVIDINLPGESGIKIASRLRLSRPASGIVIVTGRTSMEDKVSGYRVGGADFYLTKPVSPVELLLVLKGLENRLTSQDKNDAWRLSLRERILHAPSGESKLRVTSKEKELLVALSQAPKNTMSSGDLCNLFTDADGVSMSKHALEELITRMRRKLRNSGEPGTDGMIQSVWGVGYQLSVVVILSS
jgi:DNA-binding response OmpR family regulator